MKSFNLSRVGTWLFAACLFISVAAQAQTYYVRAGAAGNGSDWSNAYGNLPATLVRGATYYIATGSYGFYTFDDAPSGTAVITLRKATVANHGTSVGWNDIYGTGTASWNGWEVGRPYYTFDGATRGSDWRSGYGFRVATGGQYGINLFWGGSSTASNITIRYTEVQGRGLDNTNHDDGVYSPSGANKVMLQYCYIHDTGRCPILTGFSLGWTLEYSLIARNSSDPVFHSEGWASTADSNFIIRHNIFEDIEGTGYIVCLNRGAGVNINSNWEIYGNVFMYTEGNPYNREGCGDGAIAVINQQVAQNWKIYNNSFINIGPGAVGISARVRIGGDGQTGNSNVQVYNNFWWRSDSANHTLASCTACEARWNRYDATVHDAENDMIVNLTASTTAFLDYANNNFHLPVATITGTVLPSPYNVDMEGNIRGGDGVWDRGAFEFGGAADTNPPAISGVTVSSLGVSNAVISWTSSEGASSVVQYGLTSSYGSTASAPGYLSSHAVSLTGLQPSAAYHYRVTSADISGNSLSSGDFTFTTAAADLVAPSVSLVAPSASATVSNTITLSASATDNLGGSGVASVSFLVDGVVLSSLRSSPYNLSWDSQAVANGLHTLQARAQDASGNTANSPVVTVTVGNTPIPVNGAAAYWALDETTGGSAIDSSGYGNVGTLVNGPTHVAGKVANGLQFDGLSAHVRVANSTSLYVTNAFTIATWVKLDSAGQWQSLVSKVASEGVNVYPFSDYSLIAVASGTGFVSRVTVTTAGSFNMLDSTNAVSYGAWHHLAGVYDGATLKVFIDGVQSGSASASGTVSNSGQALFIGRNGAGGDSLKGQLDEVRVFRRALTSAEILMLKGQAPLPPINLHTN